jgi:hypothetical protein
MYSLADLGWIVIDEANRSIPALRVRFHIADQHLADLEAYLDAIGALIEGGRA